jgi:hypothetical protein
MRRPMPEIHAIAGPLPSGRPHDSAPIHRPRPAPQTTPSPANRSGEWPGLATAYMGFLYDTPRLHLEIIFVVVHFLGCQHRGALVLDPYADLYSNDITMACAVPPRLGSARSGQTPGANGGSSAETGPRSMIPLGWSLAPAIQALLQPMARPLRAALARMPGAVE